MKHMWTIRMGLSRAVALLLVIAAGGWLTGACGSAFGDEEADQLGGRILLWHAWNEEDSVVLDEVLGRFREIHPGVTIKVQRFEHQDALQAEFITSADAGLGPDVLIAPGEWVRPLADLGLIRPITTAATAEELERYVPITLAAMQYDDELFGLPEAVSTAVLFYRRAQVTTPPATLDELVEEANAGKIVALSSDFGDASWGLRAFGGRVFDEDGQIMLDRGGFANWLAWLKNARDAPGMILGLNRELLLQQFVEKKDITYFVGDYSDLDVVREALGADGFGVAPLPAGPIGSAGSLLYVDGLLFSAASSDNQFEIAVELAKFLTNVEQSTTLMRLAQRAPANGKVRINQRLDPIVNIVNEQVRTAFVIPNVVGSEQAFSMVGDIFTQVLEGVLEPAQAATDIEETFRANLAYVPIVGGNSVCGQGGGIELATNWTGEKADALQVIVESYGRRCPAVEVTVTLQTADEIYAWAADDSADRPDYDLLLGPQSMLNDLAQQNRLYSVGELADSELLQRFRPEALAAMRVDGQLLGLPVYLSFDAFFYNKNLVEQPARTLDGLRAEGSAAVPVTLSTGFERSFWGVGAFGGVIIVEDEIVRVDEASWAAWLTWLVEARDGGDVTLVSSDADAVARFTDGASAYLVGSSVLIDELEIIMGAENIGVVTLPSGLDGDATPIARAEGIMAVAHLDEDRRRRVAGFLRFVTNAENQRLLAIMTGQVPANAAADLSDVPKLAPFLEQLRTIAVLPNRPQIADMLLLGDAVHAAVLVDGALPEEAIQDAHTRLAEKAAAADAEQ